MRTAGRGKRGSILLSVMVTGVVVALIAATLMRMVLLRQQAAARGGVVLAEKRSDTGAFNQIMVAWNSANSGAGETCARVAITGYTYAGTPGSCGCSYTPTLTTNPTFTTSGTSADHCALTIVSANLP